MAVIFDAAAAQFSWNFIASGAERDRRLEPMLENRRLVVGQLFMSETEPGLRLVFISDSIDFE